MTFFRRANRRFAAIFTLLLLTAMSLHAQGFGGLLGNITFSARFNLLFFPEKNENLSAPMPILPSLGGGASIPLSDLLAFELSLDLYGNTYDYEYSLQRAVPANDEFRSAFVIGSVLGFQPVLRFNPGEKITIRAFGGIGFDLRFIFRAYGIDDSEEHTNNLGYTGHTVGEARKDISSYFWGKGRFIYPFVGAGMDFSVTEGIDIGFDMRLWFPVWRLWSGESLPFAEGFRFAPGIRVTFR